MLTCFLPVSPPYKTNLKDRFTPHTRHEYRSQNNQEAKRLLTYSLGGGHFDGHGHDACGETAVEGAHEGDGVVVGVDERHAVAGLQRRPRLAAELVQQVVGDLL